MLTENRDAALDLLRLALTEPRFDPEPVERLRAQTLASIQHGRGRSPDARARAFYAHAFPGHPYGRATTGTRRVGRRHHASTTCARAHAAALTRDPCRSPSSGTSPPAELGPLLDRVFGALPAAGPALPAVATPRLSGKTTVIDFDTPQSVVIFGDAGIRE